MITLNGTTGITTPDITSTTSTLGSLTQALDLGSTGQIVFPATQNASANANTLDDYEEGTWTPVVSASTSGAPGAYGTQVGKYVKIGSSVTVWGHVSFSRGTLSGAMYMSLPFTSATSGSYGYVSAVNATWSWNADNPREMLTNNSSVAYFWDQGTNSITEGDMVTSVGNNIVFSLTYQAAN